MNLWLRLAAVSAAVKQNVSILADNLVLGTPEHPVIVITQPVGAFSICVCVRVCVHVCVRVCVHMYVGTYKPSNSTVAHSKTNSENDYMTVYVYTAVSWMVAHCTIYGNAVN